MTAMGQLLVSTRRYQAVFRLLPKLEEIYFNAVSQQPCSSSYKSRNVIAKARNLSSRWGIDNRITLIRN